MIDDNTTFINDYTHNCPVKFVQQQGCEKDKLIEFVKQTAPIGGAMAEAGVCEGASAWFISETDNQRPLHLFDTFSGLPDGTPKFHSVCNILKKKSYEVQELFKNKPNVFIHEGIFPQHTGRYIEDLKFSFVHIDVDIYRSILDCLGFFYYRMLVGGIIVIHDYKFEPNYGQQVELAVNKFFLDKIEKIHNCYDEDKTYSTQVYIIKEKEEKPIVLPNPDDPNKVDKLIAYLKRKEEEGQW